MTSIANATAAVVLPALIAITTSPNAVAAAAAAAATTTSTTSTAATLTSTLQAILSVVNASTAIALRPLQRPPQTATDHSPDTAGDGDDVDVVSGGAFDTAPPPHANVASIILSNFLPTSYSTATTATANAAYTASNPNANNEDQHQLHHHHHQHQHNHLQQQLQYETSHDNVFDATTAAASVAAPSFPTFSPPSIESLVASSAEDLSNFRDVTFDIFDDEYELFGSPLAFDASENGLWNGRFVPPPPRPPFFADEPVLSDGLTTCDLCSWAMPTKSTFIFEGTIEKASELGWPLTLIIVSILSAMVGAIVMITVVRCRRKKASNNRNETHVQWWSRNKRPNGSSGSASSNNNKNHLRRSNIYTAHPVDSMRGGCSMLGQPSLSAASSLTAMTSMGVSVGPPPVTVATGQPPPGGVVLPLTAQPPALAASQHYHAYGHHQLPHYHHNPHGHGHGRHEFEYEHEYHQPQELHAHVQHQRQHSASLSSEASSPSLNGIAIGGGGGTNTTMLQLHAPQRRGNGEDACRWPSSALMVAS